MTAAEAVAAVCQERYEWAASGTTCHFCRGPSYPWLTDDETWAKVEPLLGREQACFECFSAAWFILGLNDGEPFRVVPGAQSRAEAVWAADARDVLSNDPFLIGGWNMPRVDVIEELLARFDKLEQEGAA